MVMNHTCYICEGGLAIVGCMDGLIQSALVLKDASIVRNWTDNNIGGIVDPQNKDSCDLDYIGEAHVMSEKIIVIVPCRW